jgi:hypothetical protein
MKTPVLFADKTPSKKEVLKKFEEINAAIPLLNEEIAVLEARLKNAGTIIKVLLVEETKHTVTIQQRLVAEVDTKDVAEDLCKVRTNLTNNRIMIDGLNIALEKKKKVLASYQVQIRERDLLLAQVDLYELIDKYNAEAAAFAKTIEAVHEAAGKAEDIARASGLSFNSRINGMPEELVVLRFNDTFDNTDDPRYFWNRRGYYQEKVNRSAKL